MARWHYTGDITLEYGGHFFNFADWKHGYCEAVEVIDLAGACGFEGAVAIESKTVAVDHPEGIREALSFVGAAMLPNGDINDNGRVLRRNSLAWRMCIAYALVALGPCDTDRTDVLQLDREASTTFDGWQAERIGRRSLRSYVRQEFLGYAR